MDRFGNIVDWRWTLARGVLGILFGILVFAFPVAGLLTVALMFAAYIMADGVMALSSALSRRKRKEGERWGLLMLEGVLSIVVALVGFFYPGIALMTLVILMSVWALMTGALKLYAAFAYRKILPNPVLLGIAGLVSLVFGVIVISWPVAGAGALLAMVATYSIFFGALLTMWSFRLRHEERKGVSGRAPTAVPT